MEMHNKIVCLLKTYIKFNYETKLLKNESEKHSIHFCSLSWVRLCWVRFHIRFASSFPVIDLD
jgi:hypothetical protein